MHGSAGEREKYYPLLARKANLGSGDAVMQEMP